MSTIRCFVAIELPSIVYQSLENTAARLSDRVDARSVRWVKPTNVHLTLRFLGDTEPSTIKDVNLSLDRVALNQKPFTLSLGALGCFPNQRKPRVIWVGVNGDTEQLSTLYYALARELEPLGWPAEKRPFKPHLTLGRVKNSRQVVNAQLPWGEALASASFDVSAVNLIKSDLRPTGAVYTSLHESHFAGPVD